eukprot:GEMP01014133.1.p1 GENE.GEMP01014133.1~~GEMP01014133.1.p1  ORF type:complete len:659 (+),score=227.63 GEMP01014133.1:80-2056(+)
MMKCGLFITALGLTFNADEAKNRPVSKVITLLHDMQKTLEKEAQEDQEIFDKMACWCTTNDKEKTQAIKDAEQLIDQLTNRIEELTGKAARLQTEIADLRAEVKDNEEALNKATKLREKQSSEFQAREQELIAAIDQLKRAVEVLSKHHKSLIQESTLINVASLLHRQMQLHADLFDEAITPHQQEVLRAFVQAPAYQSYNSRSGEIFGILQHMEEEFRSNLSDAQKTETQQQAAFEKLKEAKLEEIAAATKLADKKDVELAETNEANAEAKDMLEDTKASLSADESFLMNLKQKCKETDAEYEQRQKTRSEESQAVSKAIEVLSSDDARDSFSSTFNFVQISSSQEEAIKVLESAADIRHNPRIAQLAARAKLDAFTKVKKAIDQMISELGKEKEDEVKHKDWCDEELRSNDKLTRTNTRDTQDSNTEIDRLVANIKSLTDRIATLNQEVADLHVGIKRAGEDRQAQNTEFQQTVTDQRDTQRLLTQALSVLNSFYAKEKAALVQQPAGPPPPEGFKEYKKNPQSGGVLNLIQQIIDDAKAMEAEAIKDEEASQVAYESMIRESNESIETKTKARVDTEANKAQAEIDLAEEKVNLDGLKTERTNLDSERAATHQSCDFVLQNFEVRQDARDQEIQALKQAKAILSGAKFEKFLQRA